MSYLSADDLSHLIRGSGLRVTRPRVAVLRFLAEHPHVTVDEVASGVREELTTVSTQAVYDILGVLTEKEILRRMEPAGSAARYELTPRDKHQHLVCRECGDITDVVLDEPPTAPVIAQAHGFVIHALEVTIWGICPACQERLSTKE